MKKMSNFIKSAIFNNILNIILSIILYSQSNQYYIAIAYLVVSLVQLIFLYLFKYKRHYFKRNNVDEFSNMKYYYNKILHFSFIIMCLSIFISGYYLSSLIFFLIICINTFMCYLYK